MPVTGPANPTLRTLARDGRFSVDDARKLKSAVAEGKVSEAEAKEAISRYGDAMDPDAANVLGEAFGGAPRGKLTQLPASLQDQTLQRGSGRSDGVETLQRALMAVGLKENAPGMALASGADGVFGKETEASVRAFQKKSGIAETGVADPTTMRALNQALGGGPARATNASPNQAPTNVPTPPVRPRTGLRTEPTTPTTTTPATSTPAATTAAATAAATAATASKPASSTAHIADVARDLATGDRAKNYGTVNPWVNIDPRHAAPVDRAMGGLRDKWKCNLFGGNSLASAGFEPPYYGNRTKGGEYPNANQWYKWATPTAEAKTRLAAEGTAVPDYAKKTGNQSRFDLKDEVTPGNIADPAAREARVKELMARVQPGDIVTVDHPGDGVADGGHVRVCVGRNEDGTLQFAQAKMDSAQVVNEGADHFVGEERIWVLRPNTPRQP